MYAKLRINPYQCEVGGGRKKEKKVGKNQKKSEKNATTVRMERNKEDGTPVVRRCPCKPGPIFFYITNLLPACSGVATSFSARVTTVVRKKERKDTDRVGLS